jgi:ParB-like nuclease domain
VIKSLLTGIERVPIASLELYPGNPNKGDIPVITESLEENAQFEPVIVQAGTRRVISGNHRVIAAAQLGWTEIDVAFVEVDEHQALKMLLMANRSRDKASTDTDLLVEALSYLDEDYIGSGYGEYDVAVLLDGSALDPRGVVFAEEDVMALAGEQPATQQRGNLCPKCGYDVRSDPEGLRD